MRNIECEKCGHRSEPWYEANSSFEFVKCDSCGEEFSYLIQ